MKITSKLLISVLFLSGIIVNVALVASPAFSHEGHYRSSDKKEVKVTKNNDKTTEDKKEEKKEENHKGHH